MENNGDVYAEEEGFQVERIFGGAISLRERLEEWLRLEGAGAGGGTGLSDSNLS